MIQVELRAFLKPDEYKNLIEKYNNILHTEKQINYFYNSKKDFRFIKTKRYCELCIKQGDMHDSIKNEKVVKIDTEYMENLSDILYSLGYIPEVKWFRTRSSAKLDFGFDMCLDYTVGYGYIIEISKDIEDENNVDLAKIELGNFLESLDIDLTPKEVFDEKYQEYTSNWIELTSKVDEEKFLK